MAVAAFYVYGTPTESVSGGITLPALSVSGALTRVLPLSGAITLPTLTVSGTLYHGKFVSAGAITLPSLSVSGTLSTGPGVREVSGSITLPALSVSASVSVTRSISGAITLPALTISGALAAGTSGAHNYDAFSVQFEQPAGGYKMRVTLTSSSSFAGRARVDALSARKTTLGNVRGVLTNPSVVVPTQPDGTGGSYTAAGGTYKIYNGNTDVTTASTFSVVSASAGLTVVINSSTGVYGASLSDAVNGGQAILQALYGNTILTAPYTLNKDLRGQAITLTASGESFAYKNGAPVAGDANITLTVATVNIATTPTWSTSPSVTLTGSGTTRTLTPANFDAAGVDQVVITVSAAGVSDYVVIIKTTGTADVGTETVGHTVMNAGGEAGAVGWDFGGGWSAVNSPSNALIGNWCFTWSGGSGVMGNLGQMPCKEGDRIYAVAYFKGGGGTAGVGIAYYNSAGTNIAYTKASNLVSGSSYGGSDLYDTAPANTAYARIAADASTATGTWYADQFFMQKIVQNMDFVGAGTTYGPTRLTNLTGGNVDPSLLGGMVMRGSVPSSFAGYSFSYTSTTTSITWSTAGTGTVYFADGTSGSIPSISDYAVSSLTSGTSYNFYPYCHADLTGSGFVTSGGTGSPSAAYASPSAPAASLQNRQDRIPLSAGGITAATPASGTGGGTNVGGLYCLHPAQIIQTRAGARRADALRRGDEVRTPDGWAPIVSVKQHYEDEWIELVTDSEVIVACASQPVRHRGRWISFGQLRVGQLLVDGERIHRVLALRIREEVACKVSIELEGRAFLAAAGGVTLHNAMQKPTG